MSKTRESIEGTRPEMSERSCPFCGATELEPWRSSLPPVARCLQCQGAHVIAPPVKEELADQYQESYYEADTGQRFKGWIDSTIVALKWFRYRAIQARSPEGGTLLDIGCGRGDMLSLFQKHGWSVCGTQLSRTAALAARRDRQVDVRIGELPDLELPRTHFDVVTMFHVLEHLPDPKEYLDSIQRLLSKNGLLVIEVPSFNTFGFALLGRRDLCFDYPHHLSFFTPRALTRLLGRCGYEIESWSQFSVEYSMFTTLQNMLNLLPGQPNRLYRSLMKNQEGRALRKQPLTWAHFLLVPFIALPAVLLSGLLAACGRGNTLRVYCRSALPG